MSQLCTEALEVEAPIFFYNAEQPMCIYCGILFR